MAKADAAGQIHVPPGTTGMCSRSQAPASSHPSQPPASANASRGKGGAASFPRGRSKRAVRAGLKLSELNAEMNVETAIVRANCRKNCPVIPLMKAQGMNTALKTSPTAMTGPDT